MLPSAGTLIWVIHDLERWRSDLNSTANAVDLAIDQQDPFVLENISQTGLPTAKGLINYAIYDGAPSWLRVIWSTGAQYYFSSMCLAGLVYDDKRKEHNFSVAQELSDRCHEALMSIDELLSYIEGAVPDVYLNSPASLSDRDFWDR